MLENDGKRLNSASNSVATVKLYMRISSLFFFSSSSSRYTKKAKIN